MNSPALRPVCVVCRGNLATWRDRTGPPGVELAIATVDNRAEFRLIPLGDSREHYQTSSFDIEQGVSIFHICGAGHVFFARTELAVPRARSAAAVTSSRVELVAVLGSFAAGKSYVTVRTLNQRMAATGQSGLLQIAAHAPNFVESRPLWYLESEYTRMCATGETLSTTSTTSMMPRGFLRDIHDDLFRELSNLHSRVLGRDMTKGGWLSQVRQPVVRRYNITAGGGQAAEAMVAIADLSGELFDDTNVQQYGAVGNNHDLVLAKLAEFTSLVWSVDPAVSAEYSLWGASARETLLASVRPEESSRDLKRTQHVRAAPQRYIAELLVDPVRLNHQSGSTQRLIVAVTKADLIQDTLGKGGHLSKLGEPGALLEGIVEYLRYFTERVGHDKSWVVSDDPATAALIRRLSPGNAVVRDGALRQFATALIERFSEPDAFWDLVHTGRELDIPVAQGEWTADHGAYTVRLWSRTSYLREALRRDRPGALTVNDIVMSALACGITWGLGFAGEISPLLGHTKRTVLFVACSPFGGVPTMRAAQLDTIELTGASSEFPERTKPSAGLTQLHLHLLRRCLS